MPNNTAAARPLQAQEPFDRCVVQLRPNVDASLAAANASCLLRGLRGMAQGGVDGEGFDPDQCFLLRSSIDTVIALVDSLEASVGRAA